MGRCWADTRSRPNPTETHNPLEPWVAGVITHLVIVARPVAPA